MPSSASAASQQQGCSYHDLHRLAPAGALERAAVSQIARAQRFACPGSNGSQSAPCPPPRRNRCVVLSRSGLHASKRGRHGQQPRGRGNMRSCALMRAADACRCATGGGSCPQALALAQCSLLLHRATRRCERLRCAAGPGERAARRPTPISAITTASVSAAPVAVRPIIAGAADGVYQDDQHGCTKRPSICSRAPGSCMPRYSIRQAVARGSRQRTAAGEGLRGLSTPPTPPFCAGVCRAHVRCRPTSRLRRGGRLEA